MINLEKQARDMFSELKKHIGEEVTIKYWHYGVLCTEKSILRDVEDFERISVDRMSIPFVGCGVAITSITTNNRILYLQPFIYP